MKQLTIILTTLFSINTYGQSALFSADTSGLRALTGHRQDLFDTVMEMEWKLNGQQLTFGSTPIKIKPDPARLDTLLYRNNNRAEWDTIICNISEAGRYQFVYNTCCNGFDIKDVSTGRRIQGRVIYKIASQSDKTYLGTLGEAGIVVGSASPDTLKTSCRSVMSPNIYEVTFKEIEFCTDATGCTDAICLQKNNGNDPDYDFMYRTVSTKLNVRFMPLGHGPLIVTFDPETDQLEIR